MEYTLENAKQLDQMDEFPPLTHLFDMPKDKRGEPAIYLNGNSLGPKPKNVDQALLLECKDWGMKGVRGHFDRMDPWVSYHELVSKSLARLLGAKEEEVAAMGTLSSNLHFAFISFYQPTHTRYKIIHLSGFPSDTYALKSQVKQRFDAVRAFTGVDPFKLDNAIVEIKPNEKGYIELETFNKILEEEGSSTAVVWIEAVHYLTGQYFNIPKIVELAHSKGCKIGLDLAHAIGNVPLELNRWNVDFAVWCSYKYLSSGPGSIGGLYVNEKYIADKTLTRFAGWWGHNKKSRFQMPAIFDPIPSAESWQLSNPGIFLLAALRQSLAIFDRVDLNSLREKNKRLVNYFFNLIKSQLDDDIQIITPSHPEERGCQLSLLLNKKLQRNDIEELLYEHGIICDVRGDLIRAAPMGLYTTFADIFNFVSIFKKIIRVYSLNNGK